MTIVYEDGFAIVDQKEYHKLDGKTLYDDLVNLGFISEEDYRKASPEEKKRYDELKQHSKNDSSLDALLDS